MYTKDQLAQLVVDYANRFGIDPAIALAQIRRESANFRADVVYGPFVAGAGERGMSQFTPATWADWGSGPHTNAYVPENSLQAWGRYMTWLLGRYGGDFSRALMGYNGGPGNVDRGRVSSGAQRYAREILAAAGTSGASSNLPESSYPTITFYDDDQPLPDADSPDTDFSISPLLLGGIALLAIVLITSD